MVLVEDNQIIHEIPLPLTGIMSDLDMGILIKDEKKMIELLKERGYKFKDPAFTLLIPNCNTFTVYSIDSKRFI